jgi:hypothetical protein
MPSRSPSASFQPVRGLISWLTIFARLNRSVNRRFHVDDEDASILRTLQTLENSYEKSWIRATHRRMKILGSVSILLITVSGALESN